MVCSNKTHCYCIPNTDLNLLVCDDCVEEATAELGSWSAWQRVSFVRFMDDQLTILDEELIEVIEEMLEGHFGDCLVLYVAYELAYGEGVEEA